MSEKKKTFEESMNRLEEIVGLLEKNDLPLDETIKLFEEGIALSKYCDTTLKAFETKVNEIVDKNMGDDEQSN